MSETTLDQIRHWRDRAVQGVVTPLTTVQIIRLCDAAERAETLEASLKVAMQTVDGSVSLIEVCHDNQGLQAERDAMAAQLTEVTRQRDAIQATYDEFCAKFPSKSVMRREAAMRGPADPSAPTQKG